LLVLPNLLLVLPRAKHGKILPHTALVTLVCKQAKITEGKNKTK
jgi:hypothetical protein